MTAKTKTKAKAKAKAKANASHKGLEGLKGKANTEILSSAQNDDVKGVG
jgi:hypothetical protein